MAARLKVTGRILLEIKGGPGRCGFVVIPVSIRVRRRVSASNLYDGRCDHFIQPGTDPEEYLGVLPPSAFEWDRNGELSFADGKRFLMDEWTYRHGLVGGQAD